MPVSRWRAKLRNCLATLHRELRISLTPSVRPEAWLFVIGCYNSGTELLVRLLGSHPDISALPREGQFLTDQFPADYELGLPRMWVLREDLFRLTEHDEGPDPERLEREWLMRLDRSRPVFVEKSPPNMARTRWLQHHFERAHFVVIVRNGYAVAEGIRRKAEPIHLREGWLIEQCARQWRRSHEILLEDADHLRKVLWIRYEELARDPEATIAKTLRFLGPSARQQERPDLEGTWRVHERQGPIRNLNPESIERLSRHDIDVVNAEASRMLREFGYEIL